MFIIIALLVILLFVLVLPFSVKKVEEQLEIFLFIMGVIAVTVTSQWNIVLIKEALIEPVKITLAVLIAGLAFRYLQKTITHNINKIADKIGIKLFVFLIVIMLGLISSVITAIIAALLLVEIVSCLKFDRKTEIYLVVFACFSIGLGAALTPIGEPLSTIAIAKLRGEPYNAGFWFLFRNLWMYIISCIILLGIISVIMVRNAEKKSPGLREDKHESLKDIFFRTGKIYLFVIALIFLGTGFKPMIDMYVSKIPYYYIYWINIISAILDNATLTSAEIGPSMSMLQINSAILGLIIAGGMLIPGNIPNIISAGKLKIKSSEWAAIGVPVGLALMVIYFAVILTVKFFST
jgi:predicted cation transporter